MPATSRLAVRLASLVVLAVIWLICLLVHGGNLDRELFSQIHDQGAKAVPVAYRVSTFGSPLFLSIVLALGAAVLLWFRRIRAAAVLMAVVLSCRLVRFWQEAGLALPRPNASVAHVAAVSPYGFPSGHATNAMATYLGLALIVCVRTPWRELAVALALATAFAVGMSRIILGVHWPSDVAAGWSFGCFWIVAGLWLRAALKLE